MPELNLTLILYFMKLDIFKGGARISKVLHRIDHILMKKVMAEVKLEMLFLIIALIKIEANEQVPDFNNFHPNIW